MLTVSGSSDKVEHDQQVRKMAEREYLGGIPQPTTRERERAKGLAPILVDLVRKHAGSQDEIEAQVGRELYCAVAMLRGSA